MDEKISTVDAALMLKSSTAWVGSLLKRGKIKGKKQKGRIYWDISKKSVEEYIASKPHPGASKKKKAKQ